MTDAEKREKAELLASLVEQRKLDPAEAGRLVRSLGLPDLALPGSPVLHNGRTLLDVFERYMIVDKLASGFNRALAVRESHVDYTRFLNTYRLDESFARDVNQAEQSSVGRCDVLIFTSAMDNNDVHAANSYIRNKASERNARFERKIRGRETAVRERIVDQNDRTSSREPAGPGRPETDALGPEFREYDYLTEKYLNGTMNDAECVRYVRLQQKIHNSSRPHTQVPPELIRHALGDDRPKS
jgi:hypothetical protein